MKTKPKMKAKSKGKESAEKIMTSFGMMENKPKKKKGGKKCK